MRKPHLPSTTPLQFKKIALWGLLATSTIISTAAIGLWATGQFNISTAAPTVIEQKQSAWETSGNAKAFAETFAHEYFKWSVGLEEQRANRLKPYLAAGIDPQAGIDFSSLSWHARPEEVKAGDAEPEGNHRSIVYVSAIVDYFNPKNENDYFSERKILVVPILAKGENHFVVIDTPYLVPLPTKPGDAWKKTPLQGQDVEEQVESEIQTALESFFKVYAEGKDSEISYLTQTTKPIHGYNGSMQFLSIDQLEAVQQGNHYEAQALVHLKEANSGMEVTYPYEVELSKENGRWFVTDLRCLLATIISIGKIKKKPATALLRREETGAIPPNTIPARREPVSASPSSPLDRFSSPPLCSSSHSLLVIERNVK